MKKLFILALATLFAGSAMALDYEPKSGFTFMVFGGFDASNLKGTDWTGAGFDGKIGLNVGVKADYMLPNAKGTYLTASVDWIQKGAKRDYIENGATPGSFETGVNKLQAHYLEVPIRVGYRYNFNDDWGVFGEVGPYFAIGVTGKNRIKYDNDALDSKYEMYFGKKYANVFANFPVPAALENVRAMQRFDCGLGFRIGGEYHKQYSLTFGYDWGFTDVYTNGYRKAYAQYIDGLPVVPPGTITRLSERKNHNLTFTFGFRF